MNENVYLPANVRDGATGFLLLVVAVVGRQSAARIFFRFQDTSSGQRM